MLTILSIAVFIRSEELYVCDVYKFSDVFMYVKCYIELISVVWDCKGGEINDTKYNTLF